MDHNVILEIRGCFILVIYHKMVYTVNLCKKNPGTPRGLEFVRDLDKQVD